MLSSRVGKMMCIRSYLLAITSCLLVPVEVTAQEWSKIIGPSRAAIFQFESEITKPDGTLLKKIPGTGFIVTPHGDALTAAHNIPIKDGDQLIKHYAYFSARAGDYVEVQVVGEPDRASDVANLRLPKKASGLWRSVELTADRPPEDALLYAVGFAAGVEIGGTAGTLSSYSGKGGLWQTSLAINPGHSGGPVFDTSGRVVAISVEGNYPALQAVSFVRGIRDVSNYINLRQLQRERSARRYQLYDGYAIFDDDITVIIVETIEICSQACAANAACQAFSYFGAGKACFLKASFTKFAKRDYARSGILDILPQPESPQ